jgi:hypothetical protein
MQRVGEQKAHRLQACDNSGVVYGDTQFKSYDMQLLSGRLLRKWWGFYFWRLIDTAKIKLGFRNKL